MDKRQISSLNVGICVYAVLLRWTKTLPEAAVEGQAEVNVIAESILACGRQQGAKRGASAQKGQCFRAALDGAISLAGALCSYGTAVEDDRLAAVCDYSRSSLLQGGEVKFIGRCRDLLAEATPLVSQLGKYKITEATLAACEDKVDAFEEVRTAPRNTVAQSAAATRRLPKLLRKLRTVLTKRIDPLIEPLAESEPALFNEYKVARKRVNPATISAEQAAEILSTSGATLTTGSSTSSGKAA